MAKTAKPWMEKIEQAEERAAADLAAIQTRTHEHRRSQGDYDDCLRQLDRTAPHVPAWDFAL